MKLSRRSFIQTSSGLGVLAALGNLKMTAHAAVNDYKALVCVFMLGGNDGHNMIVSKDPAQYAAYQAARQGLAIASNQLLDIGSGQGPLGFHFNMPEMKALYNSGRLAIVANAGMLVQPTYYANQSVVPANLRSHSDQVVQAQTGLPTGGSSTGWGGRSVDLMQTAYGYNAGSGFPASISMNSPALFCAGSVVQGTSLQPGNYFNQSATNLWPASAGQARLAGLNQILSAQSGNAIIDAANRSMSSAIALNPILQGAANSISFQQPFPSNSLGTQLAEIARIISLNSQLGIGRQVFFCSIGGFDTHGAQAWQHGDLLQKVSQSLNAFYAATEQLGVANQVTAFTMSDFGRTLQPSGSGSDHGWGNHHLVVGGAVNGGNVYGRFPLMTNYGNFNASADDYADSRGTMLPSTSLSQYGATLAQWFGAADNQLDALFPTLENFAVRNLQFV
jgi:uncharacterized protein (DUF1501 family)